MSEYLSGHVRLGEDLTSVVILDQTLLPNEVKYLTLRTPEEMFEAIRLLRVRGAPAIGICAGYCLAALAEQRKALPPDQFRAQLHQLSQYLNSSRPTAVNLSWALTRLGRLAHSMPHADPPAIADALVEEAIAIHKEDIAMCRAISEYGLTLIKEGDGVLTHCNAGPLATSQYGTALGPLLLGTERGMKFRVFADETRPLLQGARLTSYELDQAGVDVTLICDNMASMVMKNGWVNACFVGCDRVAANGDAANKIGTSGVAILARHYGIPFYVCAPSSTIDPAITHGGEIVIEERPPEEVTELWYRQRMAPEGVKVYNPAFDVTDHSLITGIITERGIAYPPFDQAFRRLGLTPDREGSQ